MVHVHLCTLAAGTGLGVVPHPGLPPVRPRVHLGTCHGDVRGADFTLPSWRGRTQCALQGVH